MFIYYYRTMERDTSNGIPQEHQPSRLDDGTINAIKDIASKIEAHMNRNPYGQYSEGYQNIFDLNTIDPSVLNELVTLYPDLNEREFKLLYLYQQKNEADTLISSIQQSSIEKLPDTMASLSHFLQTAVYCRKNNTFLEAFVIDTTKLSTAAIQAFISNVSANNDENLHLAIQNLFNGISQKFNDISGKHFSKLPKYVQEFIENFNISIVNKLKDDNLSRLVNASDAPEYESTQSKSDEFEKIEHVIELLNSHKIRLDKTTYDDTFWYKSVLEMSDVSEPVLDILIQKLISSEEITDSITHKKEKQVERIFDDITIILRRVLSRTSKTGDKAANLYEEIKRDFSLPFVIKTVNSELPRDQEMQTHDFYNLPRAFLLFHNIIYAKQQNYEFQELDRKYFVLISLLSSVAVQFKASQRVLTVEDVINLNPKMTPQQIADKINELRNQTPSAFLDEYKKLVGWMLKTRRSDFSRHKPGYGSMS